MSEYPLPLPFIESMRPLLSGEMDAFLASYQQPAQRGVRFRDARRPLPASSLLGDIPWLGGLFRSRSQVTEKKEMLVFITPTIVESRRMALR